MRLRIQTYNPLPEIKAWFIPDVQSAASVYDLKEALCLRFQALKARKFSGKDVILLLDDFELLNDSPFSAVRDGDLICVRLSPLVQVEDVEMGVKQVECESNITRQRKRKRSQSPSLLISGRSVREPRLLKRKATKASEGNDSESDTSSTTSSSSSSSSTSTSSSLSSRTSSLSSPKLSTSQPTQQTINTKQPKDNITIPNSASRSIPPVPPGLGKPSTHSRNKRRRLKKGYEKDATTLLAATPGPPKGSSHTNNLPLGQPNSKRGPSNHPPSHTNSLLSANSPAQLSSNSLDTSLDNNHTQRDPDGPDSDVASALNNNAQDSYNTPNQVMMSSLRNKNKKKGFKQSMANPLPQKIIFTTNTTASKCQQPSLSAQDMLMDDPSGTIQPRLIPPSEIQELGQLPPNMFVTSVDVESGMWDEHLPSQKKQQGKKKQKTLNEGRYSATIDWHDSSQKDINFENGQFDDAHDDDSSFILPYFDTDVQTTTQVPSSSDTTLGFSTPFDWDRAERIWEECAVLEKLEQLVVGCLVGWKDLAINPRTFSPEMLLMVARLVSIGQESSSTPKSTQSIVVRYLQRPGAGRAALAFGLNGAARFNDEEQVEDDDETFEWTDILTKQWRVIKP